MHISGELTVIYITYFLATFSPGPSNMAIMSTAIGGHRKNAMVLAMGVTTGSMIWALTATLGIASLLATIASLLLVMKCLGGCYLLYLAYKSGRKIFQHKLPQADNNAPGRNYFTQGMLMHLTNPKAILTWVAIMSLSMKDGMNYAVAAETIAGCFCICITVFSFYALAFSTPLATRLFQRIEKIFCACLALFYCVAGIKLLTSRS